MGDVLQETMIETRNKGKEVENGRGNGRNTDRRGCEMGVGLMGIGRWESGDREGLWKIGNGNNRR